MIDIYVINLKERTDRWEHIKHTFGNFFNIIRIDAVKNDDGAKGCFMSHKKCLEIAKEKNLKNIIVFEDDCTISNHYKNNFLEKFKEIYDFLENHKEWDIFLGGVTYLEEKNIKKKIVYNDNYFFEINKGNNTNLVIYNNTSYDFFLKHDINVPIDDVWHHKLNGLICYPLIAHQLSGISNIANTVVNYSKKKYFEKSDQLLLKYIKNS